MRRPARAHVGVQAEPRPPTIVHGVPRMAGSAPLGGMKLSSHPAPRAVRYCARTVLPCRIPGSFRAQPGLGRLRAPAEEVVLAEIGVTPGRRSKAPPHTEERRRETSPWAAASRG